MISITTIAYDKAGYLFIKPVAGTGRLQYERRVSKNATLDGLSTISDFGFTFSDNTLTIKVNNFDESVLRRLLYFVKTYPLLRYANEDGVFLGSLSQVKTNVTPIEFIFDIKQQVA